MILPTLNEAGAIEGVLTELVNVLRGYNWEILVVDDNSTDGTVGIVEKFACLCPQVRIKNRTDRSGLAAAQLDGIAAVTAEYIIVMDADGQHEPATIPRLVSALEGNATVAVASRYAGSEPLRMLSFRDLLSYAARVIVRCGLGCPIADPCSGYFAAKRDMFSDLDMSAVKGFKLLMSVWVASAGTLTFAEIPSPLRLRQGGKSKVSAYVVAYEARLLFRDHMKLRRIAPDLFARSAKSSTAS